MKTVRSARLAVGLALSALLLVPASASAVTVPSIDCASGSASFKSVDNSGFNRSFSMNGSLTKFCGVKARWQYKMNFGPYVTTSWHTGITKYTNGTESKTVTDYFYYSNSARGAWVRLCGALTCSSSKAYVDNPYN